MVNQHPDARVSVRTTRTLTRRGWAKRSAMACAAAALVLLPAPDAHAGPVNEDDPGWSCVDDGNRICGPGNAQGAPAGCYDDGGVLVAGWPCHLVDIGHGQWDVEADPGSPQYDAGMTYDEGAYVGGWN